MTKRRAQAGGIDEGSGQTTANAGASGSAAQDGGAAVSI